MSNDPLSTRRPAGKFKGTRCDECIVGWGGGISATFHHFIVTRSTELTHTRRHTRDRKCTTRRKKSGVYRDATEGWRCKQGEVWLMSLKRYHTTTVSSPPMRQTKNKLIRQKTEKNKTQTHTESLQICTPDFHYQPFPASYLKISKLIKNLERHVNRFVWVGKTFHYRLIFGWFRCLTSVLKHTDFKVSWVYLC